MKPAAHDSETGSLPIVLLAAIVIGGALIALFITVDTGVDTARRDRDWNAAINAADAGVQEAVAILRDGDVTTACEEDGDSWRCEGDLEGGAAYVASYEETSDGWLVCSDGSSNGVDRRACGEFDENVIFGGAGVVGLDEVRLDGSASGITVPIVIGTAGKFVNVTNACTAVEGVEVYDPSEANNPCPGKDVDRSSRVFTNLAEAAFQPDGVCGTGAEIWEAYPGQPPSADAPAPWVYGEIYCTQLVDIPQNDTIQLVPNPGLVGGPESAPVKVYVDPGSTLAAAAKYPGRGEVNTAGKAIDLQFFIRQGTVDLDMKGNTEINAIWHAPNSSCDIRGNTTFTGAVLCQRAVLGGSVNFVVPDDVRTLRDGPTVLSRWFED